MRHGDFACPGLLPAPLLPMARIALAGSAGRTLLAECPSALLAFFSTPEAFALRLVCRELRAAVAAHPWEDTESLILGSIALADGARAFRGPGVLMCA
jgi:hypothetical protein